MLDSGIIYLNHGSYGACPRPVFDTLVKYQKQLEFEKKRIYIKEESGERSIISGGGSYAELANPLGYIF